MKTTMALLGISLIFCLSSCSQDLKKLPDSEVDKNQVKIAQDFATDLLTQLKDGGYYKLQDEAIDAFKNQFTESFQKMFYQQLKEQIGDFKNIEYVETWVQGGNNSMPIFRFKGDFEKSHKKLEVRVVLFDSQKIAGFFIVPWSDMLK